MGPRCCRATLLVSDPGTVLPIREIAAILRLSCPGWTYREMPGAGHMAPLTRPDLINPLVGSFFERVKAVEDQSEGTCPPTPPGVGLCICFAPQSSLIEIDTSPGGWASDNVYDSSWSRDG